MAKGLFKPKNTSKYLGNPTKIRFLSAWEYRLMMFCDENPNVLSWGSEEFQIPYYNPIKKKVCSYWPDFIIKYKDDFGNVITEVVEVKPAKESQLKSKMSAYDKVCLVLNHAKWQAAGIFCGKYKIKFRVLTEQGSIMIDERGQQVKTTDQGLFRR